MENLILNFTILKNKYSIYRLEKDSPMPDWAYKSDFLSITKTSEEISIVCSQDDLHKDIKSERDWKVLKVEGVLDFSLTGILAAISNILARANISIFAISTFDTDYILVKETNLLDAVKVLREEGYRMNE